VSVCWEGNVRPAPITQARARVIASEIPLTWRQVVWCINQGEEGEEGHLWRRRAALHHWIETAPAQEVGTWVWEKWLDNCIDCDAHEYDERMRP
jgi:hypothetical protein